jgi:hypothetical protein
MLVSCLVGLLCLLPAACWFLAWLGYSACCLLHAGFLLGWATLLSACFLLVSCLVVLLCLLPASCWFLAWLGYSACCLLPASCWFLAWLGYSACCLLPAGLSLGWATLLAACFMLVSCLVGLLCLLLASCWFLGLDFYSFSSFFSGKHKSQIHWFIHPDEVRESIDIFSKISTIFYSLMIFKFDKIIFKIVNILLQ